jgi:hypothetical protein
MCNFITFPKLHGMAIAGHLKRLGMENSQADIFTNKQDQHMFMYDTIRERNPPLTCHVGCKQTAFSPSC